MQQQLWLTAIPNRGDSPEATYNGLKSIGSYAKLHRLEIPNLVVGTLDSLMALSDDLTKVNNQIEGVVKKIERQYLDVAGSDGETLRVGNDMSIENYLRNFQWDYARYRFQGRQLPDLVAQIQSMVGKADEELKKLTMSYNEKTQNLGAIQRKKVTNLVTSDLEDFLTAEQVAKHREHLVDSEYMVTLLVVVPGQLEKDFLKVYESFGSEIAAYGGPDWSSQFSPQALGKDDGNYGPESNRSKVTGSPVVPGSAFKLHTEGETMLYGVTVLKGHYQAGYYEGNEFIQGKFVDYLDAIKAAFREKRFNVREFQFDSSKAGGLEGQVEQAKLEVQQVLTTIIRWSRAHYGEVFAGWVHLKVIRVFVESVLRYGLPVDFLTILIEPQQKKLVQAQSALSAAVGKLRSDLKVEKIDDDEDNDDDEHLPYVCHKFGIGSVLK